MHMQQKIIRPSRFPFLAQPYPLARMALWLIIVLVAYASLTPFNFYLAAPNLAYEWVRAPLPRYIPLFDVTTNILGYLPFGFLMVFAVFPRLRKWQALLFSVFCGMILSGSLESLQAFLPRRISSQVDWYSNILGTLIGALFALPLRPAWLSGNMAERFRYTIFGKQQSFFLLVLLFPWAQIHPQNAWLGMGDLGIKALRISPYWSLPFNNATQELLITAVASSSLAALLLFATKTKAPQIRFILVVTGLTIALKVFASELQVGSNGMTIWWSISVGLGLGIGLLMLWFISHLTKVYLWWISFIGLIILLILVNTLPQDPYYLAQLEILPRGRLTNFNDLLKWISNTWPFLALFILMKEKNSVQT